MSNIRRNNPIQAYEPEDIDFDNCDFTNWNGGSVKDLFLSPFSQSITNSTSDNPKQIILAFNRTAKSLQIGLGENNGGDFSNVKISLLGSGGATRSIYDASTDNTKRTSLNAEFPNELYNSLLLEFYTADPVSLSNITIQKSTYNTSQVQGRKDDGEFTEFASTNRGNFKVSIQEYGDTPAIDPFGRLRVSEPYTLFDSKQLHDKQPLFWDEVIGGSATSVHSSVNSATTMTVTASASDYVIRQTKQRFNYQPGKGQFVFMTCRSPQVSGITARIGMFDDDGNGNNLTPNNGIFFETDGDISWNIAKNGSIAETATQANWNYDTLDGSGDENNPSGIGLDPTATQILVIDYEWLGVGRVRVGFVIDGLLYYCHYFNHANDPTFTSVYMSTPNLPLRYSIETDGSNGSSIDHICSTVMSEGGLEETGVLRSVDTGVTSIAAATGGTTYPIVAIKLNSSYLDTTVLPQFFSLLNTSTNDYRWSIQLNPTLSAGLSYSPLANSSIDYAVNTAPVTVTTPGIIIDSGYVNATGGFATGGGNERKLVTSLRIGSDIAGTADELVLCATPIGGSGAFYGALTFRELL